MFSEFFLLAFAWDNADVLSRWDKIVNSSVIEIIIKESKKKWRQRFYKWMKMFSLFKLERFTNYDKLQNSFKNINIYKIKGKNKRTRRENEIDFNFMFVCFFVCFVCFSNNFCFCNKKLFQGLNPFDDQKKKTQQISCLINFRSMIFHFYWGLREKIIRINNNLKKNSVFHSMGRKLIFIFCLWFF